MVEFAYNVKYTIYRNWKISFHLYQLFLFFFNIHSEEIGLNPGCD